MTGTSSQESYEFTAGRDTSALQPAPTNVISRHHLSNLVSALVLYMQTKGKKGYFEAYLRVNHFRMLNLDLPDVKDFSVLDN